MTLHNLRLSVGELVELTRDVRQQLQPQADQLKAAVQTRTVTHGDETSWREAGEGGIVWAFVTAGPAAVRYFEYAHSRSHLVPRARLQRIGPGLRIAQGLPHHCPAVMKLRGDLADAHLITKVSPAHFFVVFHLKHCPPLPQVPTLW